MLTNIAEKSIILALVVLFLAAVAIIYFRSKNTNRSEIKRLLKTANYFSVGVIVITFCLSLFFGIFNHLNNRQSMLAIISLNYSEASQAQNSDGSRYNMAEIISDEVVALAIEKGAFENVTVKQLKNCLSVYPYVQGGVADKSEYHISTEFVVEYHASKYTKHLDSENVIKLITAAYKEYYTDNYTDSFRLDGPDEKPDFKSMEYMDTVQYFEKETSAILNYLYGMAEKNPSFITKNNTTFNSIAGKIFQFKETQIDQNLKALVIQHGVVKDLAEYMDRLSYRNKINDFDRRKSRISFELCNEAIAMYSEEMTRIVLVPTWDTSGKYYMGRTKVGVDELSVNAADHSANVASIEKEIMDNNLVIDKMRISSGSYHMYSMTQELIDSIYTSIKAFEKEAIAAGRECSNYRMNQCISVRMYGPSFFREMRNVVIFAVFAYVSFMLLKIAKKFPKRS